MHHIHLIIARCAYWLNDYMKHNSIDQVNEKCLSSVVSKAMKNISEEEFFDKLLERIELCINNHGDCFEHLTK